MDTHFLHLGVEDRWQLWDLVANVMWFMLCVLFVMCRRRREETAVDRNTGEVTSAMCAVLTVQDVFLRYVFWGRWSLMIQIAPLHPYCISSFQSVPTHTRPLNSHGATVRLTVSAVISRSHGGGLISHSLLSMSMTDLPINTAGGFNRFSEL